MATMEHECADCGDTTFSNLSTPENPCRSCDGMNWISHCDEDPHEVENNNDALEFYDLD